MVTETFTAGQDFTVPDGVFNLTVELEGAAGEGDAPGGRVAGEIGALPGQVYRIRSSSGGGGGANDGGGGSSIDIRFDGTSLSDRIAVAGGGGGEGGRNPDSGGAGGADTGEAGGGGGGTEGIASGGGGGTQTAGGVGGSGGTGAPDGEDGSFGAGGNGGFDALDGGGGGGGWYGGGGGGGYASDTLQDAAAGGGGGSNYDDGLDSVTANERGTSTRSYGEGGLVTITYTDDPVVGAENLAITDTTATSNTLAWDAPTLPPEVDSVDEYRIYRATDPGTVRADYTEVDTTPTPGFEDTGLDNGIEYYYRVGADLFVPEAEGTITITGFRGV